MDESIMALLNKATGDEDDPDLVRTNLKSLSGKSDIVYRRDWMFVPRLESRLCTLKEMKISEDHVRHLQLLDEYQSATIEGARTTVDRVLSGGTSKSDIMVKQSLAGLLYLLNNEFNESSILEAWKIITDGCCENVSAGVDGYRTGMVYVGSEKKIIHVPAKPEQIQIMMNNLFKYSSESYLSEAIIYSFYLVYVHPFADGNGRLSRAIIQKKIGLPALPLSKAISVRLHDYYESITKSEVELDGEMDITSYSNFIIDAIDRACDMYELYAKPLTDVQSWVLSKMDKDGKGYISYRGVADIIKCDFDEAIQIMNSLIELGYLEYSDETGSFKLIWR